MATVSSPRAAIVEAGLGVGVCAEDSTLRKSICAALAAGGHEIAARKASLDEVIEAREPESGEQELACLVIGFSRLGQEAAVTLREIQRVFDGVGCVLVCKSATSGDIRRTIELGAGGIVLIDEVEVALAAVVSAVSAGQVSVPRGHRGELRAQVLTTREKQILGLVVMGMTNAEIATKLFLAESTVKSHLSSAFSKLDVSSRNEAVGVILDPARGAGLGILSIPAEPISPARTETAKRRASQ